MAYKRSLTEISPLSSPQSKKKIKADSAIKSLLSQNRKLRFTELKAGQVVDVKTKKSSHNEWLQRKGRPLLLIFTALPLDANNYFQHILCIAQGIASIATIAVIGTQPAQYCCGFHYVEDPHGYIARECGVLHPMGGGRLALDCMVIIDSELRQRAIIPLGIEKDWGTISSDLVVECLKTLA